MPSFSKSFSPDTIGPGSVSTLRFDLSNSSASPVSDLAFTDTLPAGVTIAAPAGTKTCDGTLDAPAGGSTITYSGGTLGAGGSCNIQVNVTSSTPGTHTNVSGDLTSSAGNSGSATADLTVVTDRPGFSKSFFPASISFGGRSTLTFTIDNTANAANAVSLTFTDNLPAGMVIASPSNASKTCSGGTLSAPTGGSTISLALGVSGGATVAAGASCTVSVDVLGQSVGELGNLSGELSSAPPVGFPTRSSGKAGATLSVASQQLSITKSFTDDPVVPGDMVTLQFTIRNRDRGRTATDIAFDDDLDAVLSGLAATTTPLSNPCGSGSSLTGTSLLSFTGGTLAAGASCTFEVKLAVPSGAPTGTFLNSTTAVTGDFEGTPITGNAASDLLSVFNVPILTKSFLDDPVGAGSPVVLEFTITNTSSTSAATDIAFSDVLDDILQTAAATPANGFCGAGSTLTFIPAVNNNPAQIVVSGAELAAGTSCTFSVTLNVVPDAFGGVFPNTTSEVTATVDGVTVTGNPASDDLKVVGAPELIKEFIDDPVAPGDTVTLRFTLVRNADALDTATDITFSDDLTATLSGLTAIGLPANDVCGTGSSLSGTTNLMFSGGILDPGESCSFDVTLQVPAGAQAGRHTNTTSSIVATVQEITTTRSGVSDDLIVSGLTLSKEFIDDPVLPGGTVTLRFTLDNTASSLAATDIVFSDNLDSVVDNMTATGLPLSDVCGTGSSVIGSSGNRVINFQNGSLAAGATCTFDVVLQVPAATEDDTYPNLTSGFRATVDGVTVFLENASDELTVVSELLSLTKEFTDDPVGPGDTVNLRFTLLNLSASDVADVAFSDDLDAMLAGTVAVGLPVAACGGTASGTSTISFSGGSLIGGEACSFDVAVSVSASATPGSTYLNTTSGVTGTLGGLAVNGPPASDELEIAFLAFSKAFDGDAFVGGTAVLTFSIQNLSATNSVSDLAFTDDLDAMLTGATALGLPESDVCGAGSSLSGTSVITLEGGNLLPGASCTFDVVVQVPASAEPGDYLNVTSDLQQFGGATAADPATATLTVVEAEAGCPDPASIDYGGFTADDCAAPQNAVTVFNQAELDAYLQDFGFDGSKVKNVKVRFNPTGQVEIVSPCEVILNGDGGFVDIEADAVCLYGRKGISVAEDASGADQGIVAETIVLVSEEGDAGFGPNLALVAGEISVEAFKEAKIGLSCEVTVAGALSLVSDGDVSSSNALIRENSDVAADSILVQASRGAKLGIGTVIQATTIDLHSTGSTQGSIAHIRQNAQVLAGTLNQTSGNKARVGPGADVEVVGNYHMNGDGSCSIDGSATITAGSTSGNCFP